VIGMAPFSMSHHLLGLRFGVPRRTMLGAAPYLSPDWNPLLLLAAAGGILLWLSLVLYTVVILGTVAASRKPAQPVEVPMAESVRDSQDTPEWLDRWKPWIAVTIALILLSYGPPLVELVRNAHLSSAGMRAW
jgi:cytochrome c oxidase subunit 1